MMFFKIIGVVGLGVVLSGCSVFAPVKAPKAEEYQLTVHPSVGTQKSSQTARKTILVSLPYAVGVNNSTDMVYSVRPYQFNVFAKNRWATPPTQMLQPLIVEALQKTHHFSVIGLSPSLGGYDVLLATQLLQFHQVFVGGHSFFRLTLRAQLTNARTNRVIAGREFTALTAAPFNTPYGGVLAANQAVAQVMGQLAGWAARK